MKISVWDTYVNREHNKIMHFDILVEHTTVAEETVINYGRSYLKTKSFKTEGITTEACKFCHIEQATDSIIKDINNQGFSIIEMEHCD